jgi:hypothetical protein
VKNGENLKEKEKKFEVKSGKINQKGQKRRNGV